MLHHRLGKVKVRSLTDCLGVDMGLATSCVLLVKFSIFLGPQLLLPSDKIVVTPTLWGDCEDLRREHALSVQHSAWYVNASQNDDCNRTDKMAAQGFSC